jgi:iron complex outermembrane recepter protein
MNARLHHRMSPRGQHPASLTAFAAVAACTCVSPWATAQTRNDVTLEEVIVTAQKRAERLQDVPIAISVLSGEDLDKSTVQGITEALNRIPGVAAPVAALGTPQLVVRGVTASGVALNGSGPIAYYLDSTPFGFVRSALVPDSNVYDLDHVEVLRGPQGTLYGANALNGVVRVLTRDANVDRFEFKARTQGSGTQDGGENYRGDLALNVPLVEGKLAARAVAGYQDLSGWIDKPNKEDANDAEIQNLRLKVTAKPTEQLSVLASAWFSRNDYGAQSISDEDERNGSLLDEPVVSDYDNYSLRVAYETSAISVTSMTSYLEYSNDSSLDLAPFGLPVLQNSVFGSKVLSQELVLNSMSDSSWRWSLGAMYRDAEDRLEQVLAANRFNDFSDLSESFAVFGQLTKVLLDGKLELSGGLRYFEDDVTNRENVVLTGVPTDQPIRIDDSFSEVTPRVTLTYHPSAEATLYASYAEGFRSGVPQSPFVTRNAPQLPSADADSLKSYELGAKGTVSDGRFGYEAAVYYIDWQDIQQSLGVFVPSIGFALNANVNAGSASGVGFEVGMTAQPTEELELSATFSWNDLTLDEDVFSGGLILFEKGDRVDLSPEYMASLSADYGFPLGSSGYTGQLSASASYISEQNQRALPRALVPGDEMLIGRTSFSVSFPEHWTAMFFIDNVNNERGSPVIPAFGIPDWAARVRPRTIGLQLEYQF